MQKITTFLWFDGKAEEAANFYTSIFKNSKIISKIPSNDAIPGSASRTLGVTFQLEGQEFMALNGGPHYTFTPAVSLFVSCDTQAEVDDYWDKLSAGGTPVQCGWLTDKYGLSWQIVPTVLGKLMSDPDPEKAARVAGAMMKMIKLDINVLKAAYDQK